MPETKHTALCKQFEEKLKRGEYTGKLPNLQALAAEYCVAPATMTKSLRKLQQGGYISIRPRRGMFVTMRGETRRPVRKLLCWIKQVGNGDEKSAPFLVTAEAAEAGGYHLIQLGASALDIFRNEEFLTAINVDGYLFSNGTLDLKIAENLQLNRIPFVSVNQINDPPTMNLAEHDHRAGRLLLYQHLHECGCRRIAEIIPANVLPYWTGLLESIYVKFMRSHRIYRPEYYTKTHISWQDFKADQEGQSVQKEFIGQEAERLLALPNPPDAVIVNSIFAAETLSAHLERRGLRIPEDIQLAVVDAVDGPRTPDEHDYTRLEADNLERQRQAVKLLIEQIENPERPFEQRYLKLKLFAGKTTCPVK
ncbi:MAG: substrate-binding domain-containing protein [Lentisphaeria bacterium]|nr:substrate-binding domain-containing protein [Lentisphaeria bacterium]